jgi:hypothetical protein
VPLRRDGLLMLRNTHARFRRTRKSRLPPGCRQGCRRFAGTPPAGGHGGGRQFYPFGPTALRKGHAHGFRFRWGWQPTRQLLYCHGADVGQHRASSWTTPSSTHATDSCEGASAVSNPKAVQVNPVVQTTSPVLPAPQEQSLLRVVHTRSLVLRLGGGGATSNFSQRRPRPDLFSKACRRSLRLIHVFQIGTDQRGGLVGRWTRHRGTDRPSGEEAEERSASAWSEV